MSDGYRKYTICVQIIHEYALEGKIKADLLKSALNGVYYSSPLFFFISRLRFTFCTMKNASTHTPAAARISHAMTMNL